MCLLFKSNHAQLACYDLDWYMFTSTR